MSNLSKDQASGLEFVAVGETENPKHILVMLHGTGDNCNGMIPAGELFAKKMPDMLVLIPNGPVSLAEIFPPEHLEAMKKMDPAFDPDKARNWAGASKTIPTDEKSMAQAVAEIFEEPVKSLNTLIDNKLKEYGLSDDNLVIYGFSAGGAMALHSAIERPVPCAGVVSHSGHFMGAYKAVSKPKTLMMVGEQELAHPQSSMKELFPASVEWLRDLGLPIEEHVCKNLGHELNQEAFGKAVRFIKKSLGIAGNDRKQKPSGPRSPQP